MQKRSAWAADCCRDSDSTVLRTGGRFLDVSATPGQFAIAHQSATPTLNLPTAQVHSVRPDAPRKEIASGENRVISVDEE